jgi:hypothetical protein
MAEQKKQVFYMWYKSELREGFYLLYSLFSCLLVLVAVSVCGFVPANDLKLSEPKH